MTFRKSSASPPEKIRSPLFTHSPPKNSKSPSSPIFGNIENLSGPLAKSGGEDNVSDGYIFSIV